MLAKVSRDRLMVAMDAEHPHYGFADHKGYSTAAHSAALAERGPCSEHRRSFINVRRVAEFARPPRYAQRCDKMEANMTTTRDRRAHEC